MQERAGRDIGDIRLEPKLIGLLVVGPSHERPGAQLAGHVERSARARADASDRCGRARAGDHLDPHGLGHVLGQPVGCHQPDDVTVGVAGAVLERQNHDPVRIQIRNRRAARAPQPGAEDEPGHHQCNRDQPSDGSAPGDAARGPSRPQVRGRRRAAGDRPQAKGQAEKTIKEAEGYALDRVNRAKGDAARYLALYEEYSKAKDVTRRRLYLEALSDVFPKLGNKYIVDDKQKNLLPLLNLGQPTGGEK